MKDKIIINIQKLGEVLLKEWKHDKERYSSCAELYWTQEEFILFVKDFCFDFEIAESDVDRLFRLNSLVEEFNSLGRRG